MKYSVTIKILKDHKKKYIIRKTHTSKQMDIRKIYIFQKNACNTMKNHPQNGAVETNFFFTKMIQKKLDSEKHHAQHSC